jgi:hypothetical protein
MPDQELTVQEEPKKKISNSWYSTAIIILSGNVLKSIFKLDFFIGASIGLVIASVVEYYVEHPDESFADWLKKHLLVATGILVCLWLGPILLSRWLSSLWAYGIYGFSCGMLIYLVRTLIKRAHYLSLTQAKRREEGSVILLFGVLGGFVGVLLYFLHK